MREALARQLLADRARFNAKFAEARRRQPRLEPEAFADVLRSLVGPLVEAVDGVVPDKTAEVTEALYDLALELLAKELLGPRSRHPALVEAWRSLLPQCPRFVAEAPRRFVGSIANALYNLLTTPGGRPAEWVSSMLGLAAVCPDVATLLTAGQVAAWRAGLAHYRLDALQLCARLAEVQPSVARLALGLPPDDATPLAPMLDGLRADPWRRPGEAVAGKARLSLMTRIGAFRGFGGEFLTPPVVVAAEGRLVVCEGESAWWLTADVFGATLHRVPPVSASPQTAMPLTWLPTVGAKALTAFQELHAVTSIAADDTTLAVTTKLSHAVYLLAMRRGKDADERGSG